MSAGGEGGGASAGGGSSEEGLQRVTSYLHSRLSQWEPSLALLELGLDSLDLVQLRNGFQKAFKANVPLGVFTNANQTLAELLDKLAARVA